MAIFQRLNDEQGITVLLVTHEYDVARHARRVVALRDGLLEADRPVHERVIAAEVLASAADSASVAA
jgi:putative ABC transport system ATP-binding protein